MENSFNNLGISESIIKAIEEMGFVAPTEVQSKAIPHVLNNEDLIVMSKTGSGKTGAFGIPMIQAIDPTAPGPQGLILTPTRELAVQVDHDLKQMSKHMAINTTVVYGQHNMNVEIQAMKKGASIVVGTPGRVFDHIKQGNLVTKNIRYLVLDEADRMLDMGFFDQVVRIIRALPKNRVTLLFSATMPNEIQKICREYMKQPVTIEIESETKTVDTINQVYYRVDANDKRTQLNRLLITEQPDSCMIFCNTRIAVDKVHAFLLRKGFTSEALHGANTQSSRMRTIQQFKKGAFQILVATDVAARGIHIDDLSLVINYDIPMDKDSYVHRIGRTGRAGNGGRAITLVTMDEIRNLYEIEEHVGVLIEEEDLPTDEFVRECDKKASGKWAVAKAKAKLEQHKPKPTQPSVENPQSAQTYKPKTHTGAEKPRHQQPHTQSDKPRHQQAQAQSDKPRHQPSQANKPTHQPRPVEPKAPHVHVEVKAPPIEVVAPKIAAPVIKKSLLKRVFDFVTGKNK
jgi:ATP-dependent RNA helicase DeaD